MLYVITTDTLPYPKQILSYTSSKLLLHTRQLIVFIQPSVQNMSIIICTCKVSVEWY